MNIQEHINFWIESAEHDLATAEDLFIAGRLDWCLFLGHLVLEKHLKAIYVLDNNNKFPPRTHNLLKLAEHTKLELTPEQKIFLDEVNEFNLEVRYPAFRNEFYKRCTLDFTKKYFIQIKEFSLWLRYQIE